MLFCKGLQLWVTDVAVHLLREAVGGKSSLYSCVTASAASLGRQRILLTFFLSRFTIAVQV
jgi:hypothetical protein